MKERPRLRIEIENILCKYDNINEIIWVTKSYSMIKREKILWDIYKDTQYSKNLRIQAHKMNIEEGEIRRNKKVQNPATFIQLIDDQKISCPKCGNEYLHFDVVKESINSMRNDYPNELCIDFNCENGCGGIIKFIPYKGNIMIRIL